MAAQAATKSKKVPPVVSDHPSGASQDVKKALNTGEKVLADDNYLRESIENPMAKIVAGYDPIMPSFAACLSEEELTALIVYMKQLGPNAGGAQ